MAVTADNAFNNWTMCISLAKILPAFQGTKSYVHCFAHILNLIVMACPHLCHDYLSIIYVLTSFFFSKVILSPFVAKKAKKGRHRWPVGTIKDPELEELLEGIPEDEDDDEDEEAINGQDPDCLVADEAMVEEVAGMADLMINVAMAQEDLRTGKLSMSKVHMPV